MAKIKRIVVKAGSAIITEESGRIDRHRAGELAAQIADIKSRGIDVVLVSSGAIAAGMEKLGIDERPENIETLQAVASVGQGLLVHMYAELFGGLGITVGQVLLTQQDLSHRQNYLNSRNTLTRLLRIGVVPVVNENDTVSTEEITFGDNDMLAGLVSSLVRADLMVLLTDIGGLYTADPRSCEEARLLDRVDTITDEIEELGGEPGTRMSVGGMSSKIQAVKAATSTGVNSVIANGCEPEVLNRILNGEKAGTYFPASGYVGQRKHWIGYARKSAGRLIIDAGAVNALVEAGGSLLPAGVMGVEGDFAVGDCVDIVGKDGELIGRGESSYNAGEVARIKGLRSEQIAEVLGETGEEVVHRDVMVVFKDKRKA